ncbi:hypothetical protein D9M68_742440 [compost metagenome]
MYQGCSVLADFLAVEDNTANPQALFVTRHLGAENRVCTDPILQVHLRVDAVEQVAHGVGSHTRLFHLGYVHLVEEMLIVAGQQEDRSDSFRQEVLHNAVHGVGLATVLVDISRHR